MCATWTNFIGVGPRRARSLLVCSWHTFSCFPRTLFENKSAMRAQRGNNSKQQQKTKSILAICAQTIVSPPEDAKVEAPGLPDDKFGHQKCQYLFPTNSESQVLKQGAMARRLWRRAQPIGKTPLTIVKEVKNETNEENPWNGSGGNPLNSSAKLNGDSGDAPESIYLHSLSHLIVSQCRDMRRRSCNIRYVGSVVLMGGSIIRIWIAIEMESKFGWWGWDCVSTWPSMQRIVPPPRAPLARNVTKGIQ